MCVSQHTNKQTEVYRVRRERERETNKIPLLVTYCIYTKFKINLFQLYKNLSL